MTSEGFATLDSDELPSPDFQVLIRVWLAVAYDILQFSFESALVWALARPLEPEWRQSVVFFMISYTVRKVLATCTSYLA